MSDRRHPLAARAARCRAGTCFGQAGDDSSASWNRPILWPEWDFISAIFRARTPRPRRISPKADAFRVAAIAGRYRSQSHPLLAILSASTPPTIERRESGECRTLETSFGWESDSVLHQIGARLLGVLCRARGVSAPALNARRMP